MESSLPTTLLSSISSPGITISKQKIELAESSIADYQKNLDAIKQQFAELKENYKKLEEITDYKIICNQLNSERFRDNPRLQQRKGELESKVQEIIKNFKSEKKCLKGEIAKIEEEIENQKKLKEEEEISLKKLLAQSEAKEIGTDKDLKNAFESYELEATTNFLPSSLQFHLGSAYENGIGTAQDLERAFNYYELAAEQNFQEAQVSLGLCYWRGRGTEKDQSLAFKYLDLAGKQGKIPSEAQFALASCYMTGTGTTKNFLKALEYYKRAADQSHMGAQLQLRQLLEDNKFKREKGKKGADYQLGCIYQYGFGDIDQALGYYNVASKNGDGNAQYALGLCCEMGIGREKNIKDAIRYYSLASGSQAGNKKGAAKLSQILEQLELEGKEGSPLALNCLGYFYQYGFKDLTRAFEYYKQAAGLDLSEAQYHLGLCYEFGYGTKENPKEAFRCYRRAEKQGDPFISPNVQYRLALCYENGIGIKKDPKKALKYFKLAKDQGHVEAHSKFNSLNEKMELFQKLEREAKEGKPSALNKLGNFYKEFGNLKKAFESYQKAADLGFAEAQYHLGQCYEFGHGTKVNPKGAFKCYKKAADQKLANAQYRLGLCYENGIGTRKKQKKAISSFKLAADQGHPDAQFSVGLYYQAKKGYKKALEYIKRAGDQGQANALCWLSMHEDDSQKASEYFIRAAAHGSADAQYVLGFSHLEKDPEKALEYFKLASDQGHEGAKEELNSLNRKS